MLNKALIQGDTMLFFNEPRDNELPAPRPVGPNEI
jgi:hypothetical protein